MTTLQTALLLSTATPTLNVDLAEIIKQASKSPLGIVALALIIVSIALYFFRKDRMGVRLGLFAALLIGAGLLIYRMTDEYSRERKAAAQANEKPFTPQNGSGAAKSSGPCSPPVTGAGNSVTSNCAPPADPKAKSAGAR
jgi:hypothetical protein